MKATLDTGRHLSARWYMKNWATQACEQLCVILKHWGFCLIAWVAYLVKGSATGWKLLKEHRTISDEQKNTDFRYLEGKESRWVEWKRLLGGKRVKPGILFYIWGGWIFGESKDWGSQWNQSTNSPCRKLRCLPRGFFFLSSSIPSPLFFLLVWPQLFPMTTCLCRAVTGSIIIWTIPKSHLLNDLNGRAKKTLKYQSNNSKHLSVKPSLQN